MYGCEDQVEGHLLLKLLKRVPDESGSGQLFSSLCVVWASEHPFLTDVCSQEETETALGRRF